MFLAFRSGWTGFRSLIPNGALQLSRSGADVWSLRFLPQVHAHPTQCALTPGRILFRYHLFYFCSGFLCWMLLPYMPRRPGNSSISPTIHILGSFSIPWLVLVLHPEHNDFMRVFS